jgi:hypothetical protein
MMVIPGCEISGGRKKIDVSRAMNGSHLERSFCQLVGEGVSCGGGERKKKPSGENKVEALEPHPGRQCCAKALSSGLSTTWHVIRCRMPKTNV